MSRDEPKGETPTTGDTAAAGLEAQVAEPQSQDSIVRQTLRAVLISLAVCLPLVAVLVVLGSRLQRTSPSSRNDARVAFVPVATGAPGHVAPTGSVQQPVFKDLSLGYVRYVPGPTSAVGDVKWTVLQDQHGGYSFEYPANWQSAETQTNGFRGVVSYPPGVDPHQDVPGGPAHLEVSWSDQYRVPPADDRSVFGMQPVEVGSVSGSFYTAGILGSAMVAAFPRANGYLVLTANATDGALIEAFQHMLSSLKFF